MLIKNGTLIALIVILISAGVLNVWHLFSEEGAHLLNKKACAEVITPAVNPKTGECKEFPTPCDVPKGWKMVRSCQENKEWEENLELSKVKVALMYQSIGDNEPRNISESIKVIKDLNPDFIWWSFGIGYKPLFYNISQALEVFSDVFHATPSQLEKLKETIENKHYTVEGFRKIVKETKKELPNTIICAGMETQFLAYNALDPVTFKPIPEETLQKMALNLGKWNITNPKTGKPYTLEETQEIFQKISGYNVIYPDITSPEYQQYLHKKIDKLLSTGIDALWFDMLFTQATAICGLTGKVDKENWKLECEFDNPAVKESFYAACDLAKYVHEYAWRKYHKKVYVGTWSGFLLFPYKCPYIDFITENPDPYEVLNMKFDDKKWNKLLELAREKYGNNITIFVTADWGPWDNTMLGVFSQQLTPEEQREFLKIWDSYAREHGMIPVYPLHGGSLGLHVKKLAFGKYNRYDALAPEFDTYETMKELALKAKNGNDT